MDLIFGIGCDGSAYPDFPGGGVGAVNAAVVGPRGLVQVLEIQLGLAGPPSNEAIRIAAYAKKMKSLVAREPSVFFARSFASDSWATAKTLLSWRDELVAEGWKKASVGTKRINDLALIDTEQPPLPDGMADRLFQLLKALSDQPKLSLTSVQLVEPRGLIPPRFERLLAALEMCGVAVNPPPPITASASSDLAICQDFIVTATPQSLKGDGSLVILEADTSLTAAEAVAEWLAAGTEDELAGTVVIDSGGDTALLDQALAARGLPMLGRSSASPWRGALQVLPMAFAANWTPFNPTAFLDLLMLPQPPIGRYAASQLARALSREPGPGGDSWKRAWLRIEENLKDHHKDAANPSKEVSARLERWREWTTPSGYRRADGLPADVASKIAGRVIDWAITTDGGANDPLLLSVAAAASAMVQAIEVLDLPILPALIIDRLIEQVLADGATNPEHVAQAGGLRSVAGAEVIWSRAPRIVWWNFCGPGRPVQPTPWSHGELEALKLAGCVPESPQQVAARLSWGYANAVRMAGERLIFVCPALSGTDETTSHPLAHQLQPLFVKSSSSLHWRAERLLTAADLPLSGRILPREEVSVISPPQMRARWDLPNAIIARLDGRRESATSFERLVDCQLRWLILDVLGLSGGRFAEIPGTDQLLGNLAHEIANQVFDAGTTPDSEGVKRKAEDLFDDLVAAIASPLLQPEMAAELARAKVKVPHALAHLSRLLQQRGIVVAGTELERTADFTGGPSVVGRLDMLVQHPKDGLGVIDLKWTKSDRRRRAELSDGNAIQLATYGAIGDENGGAVLPGAYYLLNQRRLIGLNGAFLTEEGIDGARSLDATWDALVGTWRTWRDLARAGTAVAVGVPEAQVFIPSDLGLPIKQKPCTYCELTSLCRVAAETR